MRLGPGDMNIEHGSPAVFKAFRVEAKGERGSAPTCGDPSALLHLIYKVFIHLARKSQLTLPSSKPTHHLLDWCLVPGSRYLVAVFSSAIASRHLPALTYKREKFKNERTAMKKRNKRAEDGQKNRRWAKEQRTGKRIEGGQKNRRWAIKKGTRSDPRS